MVFDVRGSLPSYQPGDNVPPVREYGPKMVAPRLANPEGALRRSIAIQHRSQGAPVNQNNRSLFADGTPRIGSFNRRSYPPEDTVRDQVPCILDIVGFFTSRELPCNDGSGNFDAR
eukprot:4886980-Alexandrium_andersonii.AAC.1